MTKHTPGPWLCVDTSNHAHDYRLLRPDGLPMPVNAEGNDHREQRATARLISAAPELLETLQSLLDTVQNYRTALDGTNLLQRQITRERLNSARDNAIAVIAKVEV